MGKYIGSINVSGTNYSLSANYANSALTAGAVLGYTFDTPVVLFDSFLEFNLAHPYPYSTAAVTALPASDVQTRYNTHGSATSLAVYDWSLNPIATANAIINALPAGGEHNTHLTESITGVVTQTATYTENVTATEWIVPIKFKVASYYDMCILYYLADGTNATGYKNDDHSVTAAFNINDESLSSLNHSCEEKHIWGTTIPAVLFNEANLTDVPIYDASDTNYRLNMQVLAGYGNVGHVDDVSTNEFVQLMRGIQSMQGVDIISGTVQKNTYAHTARYAEMIAQEFDSNTRPNTVFTANLTDNYSGCGILQNSVLNYAFYDAYGNTKSIVTDDDSIYDEYTMYCRVSTDLYADSAAAVHALDYVINNRSYTIGHNKNGRNAYDGVHGTLDVNDLVFDSTDFLMGSAWSHAKYYNMADGLAPTKINTLGLQMQTEPYTITSVSITALYKYRDISTLITKPKIMSADVKAVTESTYTYHFDNLYISNSAFNAFDSSANASIYKAAAFNTIVYKNGILAPADKCLSTFFIPGEGVESNYYNNCLDNYRGYAFTTTYTSKNVALINIAAAYDTVSNVLYSTTPTRDVHYCITVSK